MIHFTADTHFFHEQIVELSNRPFKSYREMEESLVENWNSRVGKGDTVYHLGDFALTWKSLDRPKVEKLISGLNGQKFLISGNHDRKEVLRAKGWCKVTSYHEIKVGEGASKQRIVMSHYPLRSWNQMHRGAWMLHGHCHGNLPDPGGKIMDVGVDSQKYAPVGIDIISDEMWRREAKTEGHHT